MATNKGPLVAIPGGSKVSLKDLGKVKPTPKPTVAPTPTRMTPQQYDALLRKALEAEKAAAAAKAKLRK